MAERIIMFSGKGGVGKTSVAAATALALARRGRKTLVMSFDLAHSLSDSFDQDTALFSPSPGAIRAVAPNLDLLEIDVYEELNRQWGDTFSLVAGLMYGGNSLQGALANEIGLMPGLEDLIALNCLQQRHDSGEHEVIIVDCPPTGEALAFIGFVALLEFYVHKRLPADRRFCSVIRPVALSMDSSLDMFFPADHHFAVLSEISGRLSAMNDVLHDPQITTLRLVTNPERIIVAETKRAFLYFSMYGLTADMVVMNRLFPADSAVYQKRVAADRAYLDTVRDDFAPVEVAPVPWMSEEIVGLDRLAHMATVLYGDRDPGACFAAAPAYRIAPGRSDGERYCLALRLPFVDRREVELRRIGTELSIRIGSFQRMIVLPKALQALAVAGATREADTLFIGFREEAASAPGA
ncbi:MAG: TRC40/GET3/ArsA family transport-energizing ATPase [Alphaproteobacteria bacterium]|jgi:arsenite-transporting ATPase|nr:TRC40/GET3/ArsA family transport-energizing ATPase [Alphaproteobacteria bacterium]